MRGFRVPEHTQAFLSSFGPIRQHFALNDIYYARRFTANNSANAPLLGVAWLSLPKIRPECSQNRRQR